MKSRHNLLKIKVFRQIALLFSGRSRFFNGHNYSARDRVLKTNKTKEIMTIKKITKKQEKENQKHEAIEALRLMLPTGSTVFTILRHVSASGMSRNISLVVKTTEGIQDITWYVAKALEDNLTESKGHRAIKTGVCGMDVGFNLVYRLSRRLFPNGFKPSDGGKTYGRNGTPATKTDIDGGYALEQRWL